MQDAYSQVQERQDYLQLCLIVLQHSLQLPRNFLLSVSFSHIQGHLKSLLLHEDLEYLLRVAESKEITVQSFPSQNDLQI